MIDKLKKSGPTIAGGTALLLSWQFPRLEILVRYATMRGARKVVVPCIHANPLSKTLHIGGNLCLVTL